MVGSPSPPADALRLRLRHEAQALADLLRPRPAVTALCHENPDGDTLGAAVAVALAARRLGCQAEVVSTDGLPPAYAYLSADMSIERRPTLRPGLAIVCDAATLDRIGPVVHEDREWLASSTIVGLDHHVTNSYFGAINLVLPAAAASCEVVAEILPVLGVPMDRSIAVAILAGLIRDSQGFSSATTTARTLRAAAEAVEAGAEIEPIYRSTLLELSLAGLRLWGRLLATSRTDAGEQIVYSVLTDADLKETGADHHDAEGVAELMARTAGVKIAVLFRELTNGTRVSLRTSADVDAAQIAARFGGGGHTRRAGCTVPAPPESAIPLLLECCRANLGG